MTTFYCLSIWINIACVFFTLAGLSGDLLVIRLALLIAYAFLLLNSALGGPLWGSLSSPGMVNVDLLAWSVIGVYVHGASMICLFVDERKQKLTDMELALWRVFYRTGGLSTLLFKTVVGPYLEVVEFEKDKDILTKDYFYVLYTGHVKLECMDTYSNDGTAILERLLKSSDMFDLNHLQMFNDDNVLKGKPIRCTSLNKTKLFRFSTENMQKIAHHPLSKGVWQLLLIHNLSSVVQQYMDTEKANDPKLSETECHAIFQPLQSWEEPMPSLAGSGKALLNPLGHIWFSTRALFSPPTPFGGHPTGIRQTMLPAPTRMNHPDEGPKEVLTAA